MNAFRVNHAKIQIDNTDDCCSWRKSILNQKTFTDSMVKVIQKVPASEEKIWSKAKDIPCFEYPIFKAIKTRV